MMPLVACKIKIFVNSQLVLAFSSRDSVDTEIPVGPGQNVVCIKAAWLKNNIICNVDPAKKYRLNISYSRLSGRWVGEVVPDSPHKVQKSNRNNYIWPVVAALGIAAIIALFLLPDNTINTVSQFGDDKVWCVKCGGTGKNPTPFNDIDMIGANPTICDLCNGELKISKSVADAFINSHVGNVSVGENPSTSSDIMECVVCHGKQKCTYCGGDGKRIIEGMYGRFETDCDQCHGGGDCYFCHGKGFVYK